MPSRSRSRTRSPQYRRSRTRSRSRSGDRHKRRDAHSRSPMSNRRRHEGNREAPEQSKCLGVFGLSLYTTERELEKEFGKFGALERVQVVLDGHSGRSRGFAFVYFENTEDANEARTAMAGTDMDGRKIRVDFSITKRAHTPTPGMYMGRPTGGRGGGGGGGGGGYGGGRGGGDRRRDFGGGRDYDRGYGGGGGGRDYERGGGYERRRSPSPYYRSGGGRSRRDYRSRSR